MSTCGLYSKPAVILLRRWVALVVIISFAGMDLAIAAPAPALPAKKLDIAEAIRDPSRLDAPFHSVTTKEIYRGTNGRLIIHIQDAHSNLSGQTSLAEALDHFMKKYDLPLVLVEGSVGDASLGEVREGLSEEVLKKAAKRLLFDGVIAGEEYLNLASLHPMKIMGLEDRALYDASLLAYAGLVDKRKDILRYLRRARTSLERAKNKLYPRELIAFERLKTKAGGQAEFKTNLEELFRLADRAGLKPDAYPETLKLRAIQEKEKTIDFARANEEQSELLSELATRGAQAALEDYIETSRRMKNSQVSQHLLLESIFALARDRGVAADRYGELLKYRQYLAAFAALRMDLLLEELEVLEDDAMMRLLEQEDLKKLRATDRFLGLLELAYNIRMSSRDFALFAANEADFPTVSWEAFLNQKLAELGYFEDLVAYEPLLEEARGALGEFYTLVDRRDLAFLENAERSMREEGANAAFLIAGGYHTSHLTELLREKGYSYVVLTPIVTEETDHAKYEELLLQPLQHAKRSAADETRQVASVGKQVSSGNDLRGMGAKTLAAAAPEAWAERGRQYKGNPDLDTLMTAVKNAALKPEGKAAAVPAGAAEGARAAGARAPLDFVEPDSKLARGIARDLQKRISEIENEIEQLTGTGADDDGAIRDGLRNEIFSLRQAIKAVGNPDDDAEVASTPGDLSDNVDADLVAESLSLETLEMMQAVLPAVMRWPPSYHLWPVSLAEAVRTKEKAAQTPEAPTPAAAAPKLPFTPETLRGILTYITGNEGDLSDSRLAADALVALKARLQKIADGENLGLTEDQLLTLAKVLRAMPVESSQKLIPEVRAAIRELGYFWRFRRDSRARHKVFATILRALLASEKSRQEARGSEVKKADATGVSPTAPTPAASRQLPAPAPPRPSAPPAPAASAVAKSKVADVGPAVWRAQATAYLENQGEWTFDPKDKEVALIKRDAQEQLNYAEKKLRQTEATEDKSAIRMWSEEAERMQRILDDLTRVDEEGRMNVDFADIAHVLQLETINELLDILETQRAALKGLRGILSWRQKWQLGRLIRALGRVAEALENIPVKKKAPATPAKGPPTTPSAPPRLRPAPSPVRVVTAAGARISSKDSARWMAVVTAFLKKPTVTERREDFDGVLASSSPFTLDGTNLKELGDYLEAIRAVLVSRVTSDYKKGKAREALAHLARANGEKNPLFSNADYLLDGLPSATAFTAAADNLLAVNQPEAQEFCAIKLKPLLDEAINYATHGRTVRAAAEAMTANEKRIVITMDLISRAQDPSRLLADPQVLRNQVERMAGRRAGHGQALWRYSRGDYRILGPGRVSKELFTSYRWLVMNLLGMADGDRQRVIDGLAEKRGPIVRRSGVSPESSGMSDEAADALANIKLRLPEVVPVLADPQSRPVLAEVGERLTPEDKAWYNAELTKPPAPAYAAAGARVGTFQVLRDTPEFRMEDMGEYYLLSIPNVMLARVNVNYPYERAGGHTMVRIDKAPGMGPITMGRDEGNDIVIDLRDENGKSRQVVSRNHAALKFVGDEVLYETAAFNASVVNEAELRVSKAPVSHALIATEPAAAQPKIPALPPPGIPLTAGQIIDLRIALVDNNGVYDERGGKLADRVNASIIFFAIGERIMGRVRGGIDDVARVSGDIPRNYFGHKVLENELKDRVDDRDLLEQLAKELEVDVGREYARKNQEEIAALRDAYGRLDQNYPDGVLGELEPEEYQQLAARLGGLKSTVLPLLSGRTGIAGLSEEQKSATTRLRGAILEKLERVWTAQAQWENSRHIDIRTAQMIVAVANSLTGDENPYMALVGDTFPRTLGVVEARVVINNMSNVDDFHAWLGLALIKAGDWLGMEGGLAEQFNEVLKDRARLERAFSFLGRLARRARVNDQVKNGDVSTFTVTKIEKGRVYFRVDFKAGSQGPLENQSMDRRQFERLLSPQGVRVARRLLGGENLVLPAKVPSGVRVSAEAFMKAVQALAATLLLSAINAGVTYAFPANLDVDTQAKALTGVMFVKIEQNTLAATLGVDNPDPKWVKTEVAAGFRTGISALPLAGVSAASFGSKAALQDFDFEVEESLRDSRGFLSFLKDRGRDVKMPGGMIESLADLRGIREDGENDQVLLGNLIRFKATADILTALGYHVALEVDSEDPEQTIFAAMTAKVPGLEKYAAPPEEGIRWVRLGTTETLGQRGVPAGGGVYVIKHHAAHKGATELPLRRQTEEMFIAAGLATVQSPEDKVGNRIVDYISRVNGRYTERDQIQNILKRLALGENITQDFLAQAEAQVSLPELMKIKIGEFIDKIKGIVSQMAQWA